MSGPELALFAVGVVIFTAGWARTVLRILNGGLPQPHPPTRCRDCGCKEH